MKWQLVSLNRSTNNYLLCNTSLVMLPCYYLYPMTIAVIIEKPPGEGPHRPHEPNDSNQHLERVRVPQDPQPRRPRSSTKSRPGTRKTTVRSGTGLNFRTRPILDSEAISMRNWPGPKKCRQNTCPPERGNQCNPHIEGCAGNMKFGIRPKWQTRQSDSRSERCKGVGESKVCDTVYEEHR